MALSRLGTLVVLAASLPGCTQSADDLEAPIKLAKRVRPTPTPLPPPPPIPSLTTQQTALIGRATRDATPWADQVAPPHQRPGLIVSEPQAPAALMTFAAGCARWLHLNAAGQGGFATTPLWGHVEDARLQLKRKDLRFGPADVAALSQITGVRYVATGQLSGSPARATLRYRLWDAAQRREVATPSVSGSLTQLLVQLPRLARDLCRHSGVTPDLVPMRVEVALDDLKFLGHVPWKAAQGVDASTAGRLESLSQRSALAGVLLQRSGALDTRSRRWKAAVSRLVKQAPYNALVLSNIAWLRGYSFNSHRTVLEAAITRYPQNYLLACAGSRVARSNGNRAGELAYGQRAVANAPRNPLAWTEWETTLTTHAQSLRRGRFITQITRQEMQKLEGLYVQALHCSLRSVALNPRDADAWSSVAESATFVGMGALAEAALWKGLTVDSGNRDCHSWGLQLFQPKWFDRPQQLQLIAQRIERDEFLFNELHQSAMDTLAQVGQDVEGNAMLMRTLERYREQARREPKNPAPHYHLAFLAKMNGIKGSQDETAIQEFEQYLKLARPDADIRYSLGWMLQYKKQRFAEAEKQYKIGLSIAEDHADIYSALGDLMLSMRRDSKAAERYYRRAIALENGSFYHVQLARLLLQRGQRSGARKEAQIAIALGHTRDDAVFDALGLKRAIGPADALRRLPKSNTIPGLWA